MTLQALPGADALYDAAPCGLMLVARDGAIVHANATLCRWLAYPLEARLEGRRLQDLLTAGGRMFYYTHLQPLLRIQGSVAEVKLEMRRQDGRTEPTMVNLSEVQWNGSTVLHMAVFLAAERHRYEHELLVQRRRAEELASQHAQDQQAIAQARAQAEDRALFAEQAMGIVSHDLRNPLSVIQMSAALLERRGALAPQDRVVVGRVKRSVSRAERLISDLLDFTQARLGGGLGVRAKGVDLHEVVGEAVAELAMAYPERRLVHERSGPGTCLADAERVAQAVGNLVSNAVSHGDPAAPVTVRTQGLQGEVRVTIHNDGPPIPADRFASLFEPLVRGEQATARGVGLGLYIVRAIAQAHGGRVEVQSRAGEGTAFTIHLPVAPA